MSLINQMLRDLDARSGPAANGPVVASHAIGAVRPQPAMRRYRLALTALALLAGALLSLVMSRIRSWSSSPLKLTRLISPLSYSISPRSKWILAR